MLFKVRMEKGLKIAGSNFLTFVNFTNLPQLLFDQWFA
jgi:hypothetical protein